jgi:hypothetical protein
VDFTHHQTIVELPPEQQARHLLAVLPEVTGYSPVTKKMPLFMYVY